MKSLFTIATICVCLTFTYAQNLYFPPIVGNTWETTDPADLGWCQEKIDTLYNFLEAKNSKAFIVLKDGKIVLEKYFGTFTQDSAWYWASAGKSLTSVLVGIAQEEGDLNITNPSSDYMGTGWTSLAAPQEAAITVRNQLTMTTGLDDGVPDKDCTLPSCLVYEADAGTRWAYHNGPYTLLDSVIHAATGTNLNNYVNQKVKPKTGMTGLYVKMGYNNVFVSKARSMARFGLLMLNKGKWGNQTVLGDTTYFNQMTNSSQALNPAYGYLWWLNGKSFYKNPGGQITVPGFLEPHAPADMFSALGKNGQIVNVVPSQNLVMIRMGNAPSNEFFISNLFNDDIWVRFNDLGCTNGINEDKYHKVNVFPNPASDVLYISGDASILYDQIYVYDAHGSLIMGLNHVSNISVQSLKTGLYFFKAVKGNHVVNSSFVKE